MQNSALEVGVVAPKKGYSMLPTLIVLFLISYGLLSYLVVEQGRTIQTQRALIHDLFGDSTKLSAMKVKNLLQQRIAAMQPPPANNSRIEVEPVPGPQSKHVRNNNPVRTQRPALQKPPRPTADTADSRRIPVTI